MIRLGPLRRFSRAGLGGQAGFTLIEVVVAAGIIGLVMSLVISSVTAQNRVGRATRTIVEADQLARTALNIMALDLERALSDPLPPAEGQDKVPVIIGRRPGSGRSPEYEFSVMTRAAGREPVIRATYTTRRPRRAEEGPLIITRRVKSLLGLADGPEELVCRNVNRFSVDWYKAADEKTEYWDLPEPPSVAVLKLVIVDEEGFERSYERTVARLTALKWTGTQR